MWLAGVFIFIGWIFSVCLHEFGHAVVAYLGGDTSVKDKGYLTLNPLKYTHAEMSLTIPIILMLMGGIAFPGGAVYININRLRSRWWESAVSAAGPFANILLTLLLAIPFWLGWNSPDGENWLWPCLSYLTVLQIFAVLFNLLPIPPLDGYGIIRPWLPDKVQRQLDSLRGYQIWFIYALMWCGSSSKFIKNLARTIIYAIDIPLEAVENGSELLEKPAIKLFMLFLLMGGVWLKRQESNTVPYRDKWYNQGNHLRETKNFLARIIFHWRLLSLNPGLLVKWWQRFCENVECAPLRKQILNLVRNNQATAERLIAVEKIKNPGKPKRWYLQKVIYDLHRGR